MSPPTLVICPVDARARQSRDHAAILQEAVGLAQAIALPVVHATLVKLERITPSTYMGSGKVAQLAEIARTHDAALVIVDCALSPVQQRNLERAFGCKVIDRTALILEIFGARARTAEGKLQVELASLTYQKSRLVRSWTHLERQRGGFGFLGGPGESQIELDRRLIGERIIAIKRQLAEVVRTRQLHRHTRREVPYPLVALVGYTNAGKSTLFNRLSGSQVTAQDLLFATLDPTIREVTLPGGLRILLSDTVGFISNLPTELIAAFRATLEEVIHADLILHVRDIAHADSAAQQQDVARVLNRLLAPEDSAGETGRPPVIEIHNKIDLWRAQHGPAAYVAPPGALAISAGTGEGCDALLAHLAAMLGEKLLQPYRFELSVSDGQALAWLYAHGQVEQVSPHRLNALRQTVSVRLSPANAARFTRHHRA